VPSFCFLQLPLTLTCQFSCRSFFAACITIGPSVCSINMPRNGPRAALAHKASARAAESRVERKTSTPSSAARSRNSTNSARGNHRAASSPSSSKAIGPSSVTLKNKLKRALDPNAQFARMTPEERLLPLRYQSRQLEPLHRQVRALGRQVQTQRAQAANYKRRALSAEDAALLTPAFRADLVLAMQKLKAHKFELHDQSKFFQKAASAIASSRFPIDSLRFDFVCAQFRPDWLKSGNLSGMRYVFYASFFLSILSFSWLRFCLLIEQFVDFS